MTSFTVALLQMRASDTMIDSLQKGEMFCRQAAGMDADLALFPEMWSSGYRFFDPKIPGAREQWLAEAITREGEYVRRFQSLAGELNMAIAITYLEAWPGRPRNTVTIFDRHAEHVLTYAKVHTCEFDIECQLTPGDGFYVNRLDTAGGDVQVGAMICYDREFPESARILMLKGAEIILTPNACTLEVHRLMQFKTRATENMVGAAMANYAAPTNNGHSTAYSPVAFGADEESLENCLIDAGEEEGISMAQFDMDAIRAWRKTEAWGNAYRRPQLYQELVSEEVNEPFQRKDATR